jgi:hypothetical protein
MNVFKDILAYVIVIIILGWVTALIVGVSIDYSKYGKSSDMLAQTLIIEQDTGYSKGGRYIIYKYLVGDLVYTGTSYGSKLETKSSPAMVCYNKQNPQYSELVMLGKMCGQ